MGSYNYIIVPKIKLIIEVNSSIDEDNLDFDVFEKFLKEVENFDDDILEKKYKDLTLKDLAGLINVSDNTYIFDEIYNKLFLYWIKIRELEFEIISEYSFDKEKYLKKGYHYLGLS